MTSATFSTSTEAQQAALLLEAYRFELGGHDARQWVSLWLEFYRPSWIRDAVIEALYQGRYKSVSVRQILDLWQRRGQPIRHVTHEFESAVCRELGEVKVAPSSAVLPVKHRSIRIKEHSQPDHALANYSQSEAHDFTSGLHLKSAHAAVSFDLSVLSPPLASPTLEIAASNGKPTRKKVLDNTAWREFPSYTTPLYEQVNADSNPEEVLQAQRQFNSVLYSSAKAIQPFKPALPFSAQTLRLAKQKAIALMAEVQ